jgi:catechol 2,3-dioxygenase-like lactoylglutathione lyase family enzyme
MQIERFDHVSFTVGEIDRSVAFYGRFGYEPSRRLRAQGIEPTGEASTTDVDVDIVWLRRSAGGPMLELVRYVDRPAERARPNSRIGAAHLCFAVSDLVKSYEELTADGVEFLSAPRQDQFGTSWVYMRDPDGNTVELLQDPPAGPDAGPDAGVPG